MHEMVNRSERGFGKWRECKECGATNHSGHWWLAGFKSKDEPPCWVSPEEIEYKRWLNGATETI